MSIRYCIMAVWSLELVKSKYDRKRPNFEPFRDMCHLLFGMAFIGHKIKATSGSLLCHKSFLFSSCSLGSSLLEWMLAQELLQYLELKHFPFNGTISKQIFEAFLVYGHKKQTKNFTLHKWYFATKIDLTYWAKNNLVIEKNFWNLRLKAGNFQIFWDHYNNLFKLRKVRTIFGNRLLFSLFLEVSSKTEKSNLRLEKVIGI